LSTGLQLIATNVKMIAKKVKIKYDGVCDGLMGVSEETFISGANQLTNRANDIRDRWAQLLADCHSY